MIAQDFRIPGYGWKVRVYYAVTTYWRERILSDLRDIGCRGLQLERAERNLSSGDLNTGLTYSNMDIGETVMVISLTSTPAEFMNSWMHEMRHLGRHIERARDIGPYSEQAAYLAGYIAQRMFPVAKGFLCEHCREEMNRKGG